MKVYGISTDSVAAQLMFHEEQELNFPLLSDPDASATRKYGILRGNFANRVTFILDEKGVLRHVDTNVKVRSHGEDLILKLEELQG